jgi:hypothetical protein
MATRDPSVAKPTPKNVAKEPGTSGDKKLPRDDKNKVGLYSANTLTRRADPAALAIPLGLVLDPPAAVITLHRLLVTPDFHLWLAAMGAGQILRKWMGKR